MILERLAAGELTLTAVRLLAPSLTAANHETVLQNARHKSKREVEHIVAALRPQADVPTSVRKLPAVPRANAAPVTMALPAADGDRGGATLETPRSPLMAEPPVVYGAPPPRAVMAPIARERYRCSSRYRGRRMTSCGARRTCFGTLCRAATWRRSLTER